MTEQQAITKNRLISELTRSPHGNLKEYIPATTLAAIQEPEFLAHLISWNREKGQIRDSKVALPIISLSTKAFPAEYVENSLAHLAVLNPRELLRAYRFALDIRLNGRHRQVKRTIGRYLRIYEEKNLPFNSLAVLHRHSLKELFALLHMRPRQITDRILFKRNYEDFSVFKIVASLKDCAPLEAAGLIMKHKIPFLVALGALGAKAKDPDLVLALINRMTPTELTTNTKMLDRLGVKTNPALRAAYEEALTKAATSKKAVFKTTRAAEAVEDPTLKTKLSALQEKQIDSFGAIEGDWLILGDKSGSMTHAIDAARMVAATLVRFVKGKVTLIYFDTQPRYFDVSGKSYEDIVMLTRTVAAGGGTSIGCGLQMALDKNIEIDGIAIVSDGGENTPPYFAALYKTLSEALGKRIPVYLYLCTGDPNALVPMMNRYEFDVQVFDIRSGVDYYSLPNLVQTMRANRYSLSEEIYATPLLTLTEVFPI